MCILGRENDREILSNLERGGIPFLGWKILRTSNDTLRTPFTDYPTPWEVAEVYSPLYPIHIFLTKHGALSGAMCMAVDTLSKDYTLVVVPVTFFNADVIEVGPWNTNNGVMTATVRRLKYQPICKDTILTQIREGSRITWLPNKDLAIPITPKEVNECANEWFSTSGFVIKHL